MRRKQEAVLCFEWNDKGLPKVVRDYRARYKAMSQVLDRNPEILTAVHQDLQKLSEGDAEGREGDYTSENILRALIVQHVEGLPFREAVIRIGGDPFLQDFARMRKKPVMDFTFLDRCFLAIEPETWRQVNRWLGQYGVEQKAINPHGLRIEFQMQVLETAGFPTIHPVGLAQECLHIGPPIRWLTGILGKTLKYGSEIDA